jgi:hypothetical protein
MSPKRSLAGSRRPAEAIVGDDDCRHLNAAARDRRKALLGYA